MTHPKTPPGQTRDPDLIAPPRAGADGADAPVAAAADSTATATATGQPPAIVVLSQGALATARRVQQALPGADIHGLAGRVDGADHTFASFGDSVRDFYRQDRPLVVLSATGILIRTLAPLLQNKRAEPPVLAVAEDGSAVVPLLGGLRGVNGLARTIGAALNRAPAITTSGELRFSLALESPPAGYVLANPEAAKGVMADLLAGAGLRITGPAPWLPQERLPLDPTGPCHLRITPEARTPEPGELLYHPCCLVLAAGAAPADLPDRAQALLTTAGLAPAALAFVLAPPDLADQPALHRTAAALGCGLRFARKDESGAGWQDGDAPASTATATATATARTRAWALAEAAIRPDAHKATHWQASGPLVLAQAPDPAAVITATSHPRGQLAVVGLGPGADSLRTPEVRDALASADHIVGYAPYVAQVGHLRPDQKTHCSDNRVELDRARDALALAAAGERVAVVSSGDAGIFAMAAAVLEALEEATDPLWHGVDMRILPGLTAAQVAAARVGAPLGHDFCVLSLSDNLKPFPVILERLDLAARADLVLALYNPISRARPWQLAEALACVARHRSPETPVVLGRDVGRPGERITQTTLGTLTPDQADMRTVILIGSSTTRRFPRPVRDDAWVYTPRWYPTRPDDDEASPAPSGSSGP